MTSTLDDSAVETEGADPQAAGRPRAVDAWKRRDLKARMLAFMVRCRSRLPGWHEEALGVLAMAEADGVRVLEAALPAIGLRDGEAEQALLRHQLRHVPWVAAGMRPLSAAIDGGARFALAIAAGYTMAYLLLEAGRTP